VRRHVLIVARHAQAMMVSERVGEFVNDPNLSSKGEEQAAALAKTLVPLVEQNVEQHGGHVHLVCSPMRKALRTAAPLAMALDQPITVHGSLFEYKAEPPGTGADVIRQELPTNVGTRFMGFTADDAVGGTFRAARRQTEVLRRELRAWWTH